jgi:hypothetical protein
MLPPGHLAAGYLTTKLSISMLAQHYPQANEARFWAVGMLASVLVDLDMLYTFFLMGRPVASSHDYIHRKFLTHAPLFHFFLALAGFLAGWLFHFPDLQVFAAVYWVGTWTHFVFDSFSYGIMWLWPFSKKIYAIAQREREFEFSFKKVFEYWTKFLLLYFKNFVFYMELAVVVIAILVKFKMF